MNNKIIVACAVVFSGIVFGFSSYSTKAENSAIARENGKCKIASFEDSLASSAAIFVGEVISEKKEGDTRVFEFKVEKYWKGAKKKKIEISVYETTRYQAWFKVGGKYLVYAVAGDDGTLHVRRCSRNRDIENASEDIQRLGKGKRPK